MSVWLSLALPCLAAFSSIVHGQEDGTNVNSHDTNNTINGFTPPQPPTPPPLPEASTMKGMTAKTHCPMPHPDWNDPSDTVILLDTSESFGLTRFDQVKDFFKKLIHSTTVLRPNFTRLAILTFADNHRTLKNYISKDEQIPECELFADGGFWETNVVWKRRQGENIQVALTEALNIFNRGREMRQGHKQRLWIASDMRRMPDAADPKVAAVLNRLKEVADIYGVGHGGELFAEEEARFKDYVSKPAACFYNKLEDWKVHNAEFTRPDIKKGGDGDWVDYVERACSCDRPLKCQCQEFSGASDNPELRCILEDDEEEGPDDDGFFTMGVILGLAVGGSVFVLSIIVIIIVCLCVRRSKGKDKPTPFPILRENTSTNTSNSLPRMDTEGGNIFKSSKAAPDHIYANDIVPEIIREHTLPKGTSTEPGPSLPPRQAINTDAPRPPGLPKPLSSSFCSSHTPSKSPFYIDVLDDPQYHLHPTTFPRPTMHHVARPRISDSSGLYEHIMDNRSRQPSVTTSRGAGTNADDGDDYLCMKVQKVTVETETQTTIAGHLKNFGRSIGKAFGRQPHEASTLPAPKRPKANPKKFQGNSNTLQAKRNSAKVGTVRFKSLIAKFNKDPDAEDVQNDYVGERSMSRQSSTSMDDIL